MIIYTDDSKLSKNYVNLNPMASEFTTETMGTSKALKFEYVNELKRRISFLIKQNGIGTRIHH